MINIEYEEEDSIVDDIVEGLICCRCTCYFKEAHGYPVLCPDCYDGETEEERDGLQRAIFEVEE